MIRKSMVAMLSASLVFALPGGTLHARGFRGGGGGGGGARGGSFGGGGGARGGNFGGGGGYWGGSPGGAGGMSSFGHASSFGSSGSVGNRGGVSSGSRGAAEGMNGGQINYGSRSGSYDTSRGGTVNYGAAGIAGQGAGGGAAGRGAYGISGTTAGGRSYADVGRAGGAVGPGGNAVAGRSNIGAVEGPRGTAVGGSRSVAGEGPGGAFAAGSRGVAGEGPGGAFAAASRGGVAAGSGGAVAAGSRGVVAGGGYGGAVAGRGYAAGAYRPNGYNAYGGYHQGWVHGYWNGHNDAAWGWRNPYWGVAGVGVGMGLGWGLSSWGFGSSLYGMGYLPYSNPYYATGAVGTGVPAVATSYDYSQPIDTTSAPADPATTDPAMALFDAGRASFLQGNYDQALGQTNDALAKLPNDTTLHEFRALCLFALGRYDEAAATLYAVLSVGPGWDWTTLIGLYPSVDAYTAQLRALEGFCKTHNDSASGPFVLAYQYLTAGHTDAAVNMLKRVVALKPDDVLSTKLIRQLDPSQDTPAPANAPASTSVATIPPQGATIEGTWRAQPVADTAITLSLQPGGAFTWQTNQKGQTRQFAGSSTFGDGMLTLVQDQGPALVGRVNWADAAHMTFRIVGDGPDDPGLNFAK